MGTQIFHNPDGSTSTITIPDPVVTVAPPVVTVGDASYDWAPPPTPPAAPTMLVGSDLNPESQSRMPGVRFGRFYCGPGVGFRMPTIPGWATPMISIKDDPGDVKVANSIKLGMATLAKAGIEWYVDYDHEPEGDTSRALYQDRTVSLADLVAEYGGGYAKQIETFTLFAQMHGKNGPDGLDTRAEDMWTGRAQYVGVDAYQEHQLTSYPTPQTLYARAVEIATNVKAKLLIPELGRQPISGDVGHGAGLAYAADITYLASIGVVAVGLWDQGGCALTSVQLPYVNAAVAALA